MKPPEDIAPQAMDPLVERQLIGLVIYGHKGIHPQPPPLPPSRFGYRRHQIIWAAVLDQYRKGLPYDIISVVTALKDRGELTAAGGHAYVASLTPDGGTLDSLTHYASRIRATAARRAFGGISKAMARLAEQEPDCPEASVEARYHAIIRRADALCDLASRNGHAGDALHVQTLHALLMAPQEPIPWIFEPWLAEGDIMVLAGESGLGKSILALSLMLSLAVGEPLGGTLSNRKGRMRVLYVDEENNPRLIRYRLRRLIDGMDLGTMHLDPSVTSAEYATENGVNVDDHASLDRLKRKVDDFGPHWIIFDSLVRMHHSEENSNSQMAHVLGTMKGIARGAGSGASIIHHLAKPSKERPESDIAKRIRGAGDILGVADTVWGVQSGEGEDSIQIVHIKSRWGPEAPPLSLAREDVHHGNGMVLRIIEPETEGLGIIVEQLRKSEAFGRDRPSLIGLLEASGYASPSRTVSRILAKLHADGTAKKAKRGKLSHWWLSDFAPNDAA